MSETLCIVIPSLYKYIYSKLLQMDRDQPDSIPAWPPYPGFKLQPIPTFPRDPSLPDYTRNPSLPNLPSNFLPMHNWLKNPNGSQLSRPTPA